MITITERDLRMPIEDFMREHGVRGVRKDIPRRYLGKPVSRYYKVVKMDIEKSRAEIDKIMNRFMAKYPRKPKEK